VTTSLKKLRRAGLDAVMTADGGIAVDGPPRTCERWRQYIAANRAEIVEEIAGPGRWSSHDDELDPALPVRIGPGECPLPCDVHRHYFPGAVSTDGPDDEDEESLARWLSVLYPPQPSIKPQVAGLPDGEVD
jgi:hypothetical protein